MLIVGIKEIWGAKEGRAARRVIESLLPSGELITGVSFEGTTRLDVPGARAAFVELVKWERGKRGFYVQGIADVDVLENLEGAAMSVDQPLIVNFGGKWQVIGPPPGPGLRDVFNHVMSTGTATTNEVMNALDLKAANASNKLRDLVKGGYLIREDSSAQTGGIEHIYRALLPS